MSVRVRPHSPNKYIIAAVVTRFGNLVGFIPQTKRFDSALRHQYCRIEQLVVHHTLNVVGVGSTPTPTAKLINLNNK